MDFPLADTSANDGDVIGINPFNPFNTHHTSEEILAALRANAISDRPISPEDFVFGCEEYGNFKTTDAVQIYGGTGDGKTLLTMHLAVYAAAGVEFLGWPCPRPRKVLYLDGELAESTIQKRIKQAVAGLSHGARAVALRNLVVFNRDIANEEFGIELAALDKDQGHKQIEWLVSEIGRGSLRDG